MKNKLLILLHFLFFFLVLKESYCQENDKEGYFYMHPDYHLHIIFENNNYGIFFIHIKYVYWIYQVSFGKINRNNDTVKLVDSHYGFTYSLTIRNDTLSFIKAPKIFQGLDFENSSITNDYGEISQVDSLSTKLKSLLNELYETEYTEITESTSISGTYYIEKMYKTTPFIIKLEINNDNTFLYYWNKQIVSSGIWKKENGKLTLIDDITKDEYLLVKKQNNLFVLKLPFILNLEEEYRTFIPYSEEQSESTE